MATTSDSSVSFDETDTRSDEMNSTIEQWINDLVAGVDEAQSSTEFQEWLDVQSRFHDYSYRNTLLIKRQCPEATRVAGYRTWQEDFDRHVHGGRVGYLDLGTNHHEPVPRVRELAELPQEQRL